jgi:oxygen-independent coproporphyrinogen-3 oxidase
LSPGAAAKGEDANTVGVYVHVPFCERVCPYCDFAVVARPKLDANEEARFVDALLAELEARREDFAGLGLATLYFGGGTPSLLRPDALARVREAVLAAFPPLGDCAEVETTLEVNPSTVERERLPAFRSEAGASRLSVGVQSFDDSLLKALGRAHREGEIHLTLDAARAAGFENISIDLIFAALHQTPAMLDADVDATLRVAPEHVSTYELVLEPGTPFGRARADGKLEAYPIDSAADLMERLHDRLGAAGYLRYELTNHAKPGFASAHNRRYWLREPVLALGPGAHSTDPPTSARPFGARPANPRSLADYLARVEAGGPVACEVDVPDRAGAMAEAVFLGLRLSEGLAAGRYEADFGEPPRARFGAEIDALLGRGLLDESSAGDLRLTARGVLLADMVCEAFV